jgi:hypothetical protein
MVGALAAQLSGRPFQETPPITLNDVITYFPQACGCSNELLADSFLDVPWEEPDLIKELVRPWLDRRLLVRTLNYLALKRGLRKEGESSSNFCGVCSSPIGSGNKEWVGPGDPNKNP